MRNEQSHPHDYDVSRGRLDDSGRPAGAAGPLPVLDSTRLLARAAFDTAIGRRALPTWRGGPVVD